MFGVVLNLDSLKYLDFCDVVQLVFTKRQKLLITSTSAPVSNEILVIGSLTVKRIIQRIWNNYDMDEIVSQVVNSLESVELLPYLFQIELH